MKSLTFQFKTLIIKKKYTNKVAGSNSAVLLNTLLSVWLLHYAVLTGQVTYSRTILCSVTWKGMGRNRTLYIAWMNYEDEEGKGCDLS